MGMMVFLGLLFSCSSDNSVPTAGEGAERVLALDEGSGSAALENKFADYHKDVVRDEEGNISKDSKRSNFEGKQVSNIGGKYANRQFAAERYSKKNWTGTKNFDAGRFQSSKNRWDDEEWFFRKQAQESGSAARSQGQTYETARYGTSSAREQGARRLDRSSNVQTDIRRRDYDEPRVIQREDYEKLSLEESKSILGR